MSIVSPPPTPSSTSFAAPPTAFSSPSQLSSPAPTSQPNDNSSSIASPPPSTLPPQSAPPINATSPPIASAPLPQSPPPTNITLPPPASSPPPLTKPTPPLESTPPISPPPLPSSPPSTPSAPPPTSSLPPSSSPPPSSSTPSSPRLPQPEPTSPASSPPSPPTRPPALSPPHSSTLPPALSPPAPVQNPKTPPAPVQNPKTPPAPRSPGNPSREPPKSSSHSPPSSKTFPNSPPSKPPQSSPDSPALVPAKNLPPSPASLPPSNSASSSSPPTDSSLPTPTAQLSPPQTSNGAQPSFTPPSPSFPSGDATASRNNSTDRSKAAGDGGIGTGGSVAIGIILVLLLLGIIGAAGWCIWKRKKKDSGLSDGGYILPTTLVSSPKSGSASLKVRESTHVIGNGTGSIIVNSPGNPGGLGHSKPWLTYQELREATNEFSEQNLLGEGGFGSVYKGCLADGRDVAVKKLNIGGSQGEREFRAEVEIISRVHHRHLVSLVGYCIYESGRLLVYDYVPNDTLYFHLHGQGKPVLDWPTRVKIAVGAARGIAYLHEDCCPRIIHRDIKSSNILLDNNFEAQVSDFGLAKLAQDAKSHVTTRVMGTFGYMAPEYASSGKLTEKSDVYSFGVVLLELITGRKPVDASQPLGEESLVEWARPLLSHALEKEEFDQLADPRLEKNYVDSEMFRMIEVAAACVRHSAAKRPGMGQIIRAFDSMLMSDLTNGMKVGESAIYNSAEQSAQIRVFRRMAFASQDFNSDFSSQDTHYSRELTEHG